MLSYLDFEALPTAPVAPNLIVTTGKSPVVRIVPRIAKLMKLKKPIFQIQETKFVVQGLLHGLTKLNDEIRYMISKMALS